MRLIHKNQRGYTFVEVLVGLAIIGFISGGLAMTIFQVITIEARTSNHMTAVRQVQNAGYWISRDAQMAQLINTEDDEGTTELEVVTLGWTDWDDTVNEVIYILLDSELKRSHSYGEQLSETIVAQYIDSIEVMPRPFVDGKLTLTVTATVGGGWQEGSETRVYEVLPRPGS